MPTISKIPLIWQKAANHAGSTGAENSQNLDQKRIGFADFLHTKQHGPGHHYLSGPSTRMESSKIAKPNIRKCLIDSGTRPNSATVHRKADFSSSFHSNSGVDTDRRG